MKQMPLDEFLKLPPGAVFSFWKPCVSDGLHVKGETIERNPLDSTEPAGFYYLPLLPEAEDTYGRVENHSPVLPTSLYRWGVFDFDQLFAVYEADDLAALVSSLGANPHEVG